MNPGDEAVELVHEILQELSSGLVGHVPVTGDQARLELNICLERIHERRVAECEDASQVLLRDRRADLLGEAPITAEGLRVNAFLP